MSGRRTLYLVTEPDGTTLVGLWLNKTELAVYLRNYAQMNYRVFSAQEGSRPHEVASVKVMEYGR